MSSDIQEFDYFERQHEIVSQYLKGTPAPMIAKNLQMKPSDVRKMLGEWTSIASNNVEVKQRAKEAIAGADKHYSMVIEKLWETVEQAEQRNDLKVKYATLKTVSDVESKRIGMLQQAGLLNDQELADDVIKAEKKIKQIKELIRRIGKNCPTCKAMIAQGLSDIMNEAVPVDADLADVVEAELVS